MQFREMHFPLKYEYAEKLSPGRLHQIVHGLYIKAGLITRKPLGRRYDLRAHSIRKFFRTQMAALGVDRDYIEHMMGHTISTYHDIKMKGLEFLRGIYMASGLSIKPKTRINKIDALKEIRENQTKKSMNSCLSVGSPGEIRTPVDGSKARHSRDTSRQAYPCLSTTVGGVKGFLLHRAKRVPGLTFTFIIAFSR